MCTISHFICEASLIQGRIHLQAWAQKYLLDKVSSGWYIFARTDQAAKGSPLPRYKDISKACEEILERLTGMMNEPAPVSLLVTA